MNNHMLKLKLDTVCTMVIIPAGCWQAACSDFSCTFVSYCIGPGFDFEDFEMLRDMPKESWPKKTNRTDLEQVKRVRYLTPSTYENEDEKNTVGIGN